MDTRDLIEKREYLIEELIQDFNEKFNTDFETIEEIKDIEPSSELEEVVDEWFFDNEDTLNIVDEINYLEEEIGCDFEYGVYLIEEKDFTEYCQEFVEDCGYIGRDLPTWITNNIDWDSVADDLRVDYSEIDYQGFSYLYRA